MTRSWFFPNLLDALQAAGYKINVRIVDLRLYEIRLSDGEAVRTAIVPFLDDHLQLNWEEVLTALHQLIGDAEHLFHRPLSRSRQLLRQLVREYYRSSSVACSARSLAALHPGERLVGAVLFEWFHGGKLGKVREYFTLRKEFGTWRI